MPEHSDTTARRGKALLPENLVADFGVHAQAGQHIVRALYGSLRRVLDDRRTGAVNKRFEQWQTYFGEATGYQDRPHPLRDKPQFRAFARRWGVDVNGATPARLFFTVHTYYALLSKLLAFYALTRFTPGLVSRFGSLYQLPEEDLRRQMAELERGGAFRTLGVGNLVEGDFFNWYLKAWDDNSSAAVRLLLERLRRYDPAALEDGPQQARDPLKTLYHHLIPKELRHDLGEYYTPDWLAEHVLNEIGYDGQIDKRLIDPSCGSGVFLAAAIRRLRERCFREGLDGRATLERVLRNIVGVDLNPLAVVAARTNYLLALGGLLERRKGQLELPVYLDDSILAPFNSEEIFPQDRHERKATAALCYGQFEFVAGNPPWVGWESLPAEYRRRTQPIWLRYGLFPHGAMATILGQGKKDLSMLMSYVVADRFMKYGGKLGFVITQSVFKTSGASQGFRRFRLGGRNGAAVRVDRVDDMTDLRPFEGAANRTVVFVWTKGKETTYPVSYRLWQKTGRRQSIRQDAPLAEVLAITRRLPLAAEPVDVNDSSSAWFTAKPGALGALRPILGPSDYQAREGVNSGGANGVYWVKVIHSRSDGHVVIQNIAANRGGRRVAQVTAEVEADVVFPLLRGREVRRWRAKPSAYVIMAQDPVRRRGMDEDVMQRDFPKMYAHLKRFEAPLRARAAFRRYFTAKRNGRAVETGPFYSMFNVGKYTFAPHKVVWHRMVAPLQAAAIGQQEGKPILPQETHAFAACGSAAEAHYLAGMLNSTLFNFAACACSQAGGKSFGSPHILRNLHVPRFDASKDAHRDVARVAEGLQASIDQLGEEQIEALEQAADRAAAKVWGVGEAALDEIRRSMRELTKADLVPWVNKIDS